MFNSFYMSQMYFLYMYWLFCQQQMMMQNSIQGMLQFMTQNPTQGMMQKMAQNPMQGMMQFMSQNPLQGMLQFMAQNPLQGMKQFMDPIQGMKQFMNPEFLMQQTDLQKLFQIDVSPENLEKLQQFLEFFFDACSKNRGQR